MSRLNINLTQLESFIQVVEAGSFATAAEILDITAVAVSKQITALEKSLGVVLFIRTTRSLQLTKIGHALYERSQHIIENVEELNQLADFLQQKPEGKLTVFASASMYRYVMLPHLNEFMQLYPDIELKVLVCDSIPALKSTKVDMIFGAALAWLGEENRDLQAAPLIKIRRVLAASFDYLQKHGRPKSLIDLENFQYLHDLRYNADSFYQFCEEKDIKLTGALEVDNVQALAQSVYAGLGIALLADYIVRSPMASGEVEILDELYQEDPFQVYILHEKMKFLPVRLQVFKEFYQKKLNKVFQ